MKCFLTYSDLTRVLYIIRFEQCASRCNQSRCKQTMNFSTDALYPQTHSNGSWQQMRVVVIFKQRFSQQIDLGNSWAAIFTHTVEMNGTVINWLLGSTAWISANKNGMAPQWFPISMYSNLFWAVSLSGGSTRKHTKNNKLTQNTLPHICTANQLQWLSHFPGHSRKGLSPARLWYHDII